MSGPRDGSRALVAHLVLAGGCAGHHVPVATDGHGDDGGGELALLVDAPQRGGTGAAHAERLRVALAGDLHARRDLAAVLSVPVDTADARLLALAWERWGARTPRRLYGEYAAVVHEPGLRRVTLVRDHVGTHPLFWYFDGRCVCVATSMELLLQMLPQRPAVDLDTVVAHLADPVYLGARTFLTGVRMVEPGRMVVVTIEGPTVTRWWDPADVPMVARATGAEHWTALNDLVVHAVEDRLPVEGAVGVHLSGGVDSTAVALVARERLTVQQRALRRAYTWSPPRSDLDPDVGATDPSSRTVGDERVRLERLSGLLEVPLVWSSRGTAHMRTFLRRPVELSGASNVFDELAILAQAQEDGVRVLLSGWGGDEAISAHAPGVPAALLRAGRPLAAARLVRRANGGTRPLMRLGRVALGHALLPLLPGPLTGRLPGSLRGPGSRRSRGSDGTYLGATLSDRLPPPRRRLTDTADPRADLAARISAGYLGERMATWSVWSAPHGVVHRYPLTDRRIMEHVLAAPPALLWADGRSRAPIRAVLRGRVTGVLSKADPANERQRLRMLRGTWTLLGDEVRSGTLDLTCDWLDVAALRTDLLRGPSGDDHTDVRTMLRMMPALRVLDLFQRSA